MYGLMSKISQIITEPVTILINSFEQYPLVVALLLGLIGAVAPCQLTGNMSAITLYGNRTIQMKNDMGEIVAFILGKVVVFSSLGLFVWFFGESFEQSLIEYFPLFRKVIGPLIIITGLVLLGILKLGFLQKITMHIPMRLRNGKLGSFMLGASFSLAFCPTMFVLFFVWLMPLVVTTSYGLVLPVVFGLATSLPLIVLFLLIWFFDAKRLIMKKSMKAGRIVQRLAGVILIIIGIADTITYWGI
ncbi:cytochrome C biosynthesis protein [Sporosarcina sp. P12(2017)]|uniref:urease accessory protein UreH domain-containing protein n=1 Tax=unclassified Sporosarcina TaxID=2647733 RepID=UPI000C166F9E|nr:MULTISPECIES: sulfite exporter TauE/SafE family protein [unclassified Sporosarcina]PIC56988.1 cytochrome C biosynthesis protein [Sporosarcina sp. P10]PIC60371.1 cytochrome C biosynthesis protein [Sporosarcina sp. P12(2017)]PIC69267.1 cytochrome C biosynthesis protein [Sporosarcina sp. P16b]